MDGTELIKRLLAMFSSSWDMTTRPLRAFSRACSELCTVSNNRLYLQPNIHINLHVNNDLIYNNGHHTDITYTRLTEDCIVKIITAVSCIKSKQYQDLLILERHTFCLWVLCMITDNQFNVSTWALEIHIYCKILVRFKSVCEKLCLIQLLQASMNLYLIYDRTIPVQGSLYLILYMYG